MRSQAIILALLLIHLPAPARAVDPVHFAFSVQVFSVDSGITEIAPGDFFEIAYTIDQSIPDQNNSIGAGTFPSLATAFSLAARPLNAGTWNPLGTFDLAGGNYVTNAFGDNFTFQVHGTGFPNGGPGLTFFDLSLNWKWPADITDSGLGDKFGQQFGVTFNPARGVLRASAIRFRTAAGEFHEAVILPETPALAGDYNFNGIVDAADYTVWRDSPTGPGILTNDATPGIISDSDYDVWKSHFGQTGGSGSTTNSPAAIPEPPTYLIALVAISLLSAHRPPRSTR